MESPYGNPTNVLPYITMAYGLGVALLFGYGIFLFLHHGKLQQMRDALKEHEKET
jgi:hypothetical protein